MSPITLGIIIGIALIVLMVIYAIVAVSRRAEEERRSEDLDEQEVQTAEETQLSETTASYAVQQIEEIVARRLEADAELAHVVVDFGTAPDGSLWVWVNGDRYDAVEDVPDERVRAVIHGAVADYNERD